MGLATVAVLVAVGLGQLAACSANAPQSTDAPAETTDAPRPTRTTINQPGCDEIEFGLREPVVAGEALPASVMLPPVDWGDCWAVVWEAVGYEPTKPRPDVCLDDKPLASDAHRVAGRARGYTSGYVVGSESVTRYERGHAAAFLDEIRARVARCATFTSRGADDMWQARIVRTGFAGDDSLLVSVGRPWPELETLYPEFVTAVVRVGDHVVVVDYLIDQAGDRDHIVTMARKAVGKL